MRKNYRKQRPCCQLDNSAIMIGLSTLPIAEEVRFKDELKEFYKNYQQRLENAWKLSKKLEDYKSTYYIPTFYYMLSRFNLATLCIIDDFEFSSRVFGAFHPCWPVDGEVNSKGKHQAPSTKHFACQAIIGPTPKFNESNTIDLALKTFQANPPLPLMAISQMKLNNALLIGAGTDYVRCVIKTIYEEFKRFNNDNQLSLIILESTSWHEITLLIFGRSYQKILNFILKIRELDLHQMTELLAQFAPDDLQVFNESYKLIDFLTEGAKISGNHIFAASLTTLGFRFELFEENNPSALKKELTVESESIFTVIDRASVKTGHLRAATKILKNRNRVDTCLGRGGDILIMPKDIYSAGLKKPIFYDSYSLLKNIISLRQDSKTKEHFKKHITSYSTLLIPRLNIKTQREWSEEEHCYIQDRLEGEVLGVKEIREVDDSFKKLRISKAVTKRFFNAIALYNEGIQDRLLFNSFLEMKDYISWLKDAIKENKIDSTSLENIAELLSDSIDIFERAWRNRFHVDWRLSEITDFNLEFKGGIHQLISAYDGAYKAVSEAIGFDRYTIALVSGAHYMSSTEKTIELNFYNLFHPEFFAARAAHEVSEHLLDKINSLLKKGANDPQWDGPVKQSLMSQFDKYISRQTKKYNSSEDLDFLFSKLLLMNANFFAEVFADLNSFYFTFFKDRKLYNSWFNNFLFSDPTYWKLHEGKPYITLEGFIVFFLRLLFVNPSTNIPSLVLEFVEPRLPFSTVKHLTKALREIVTLCIEEDNEISSWRNAAIGWIEDRFESTMGFSAADIKNPSDIYKSVKYLRKMEEHLNRGQVYPFDELKYGGNFAHFQFVQSLFYAYLKVLDRLSRKNGKTDFILRRNDEGDPEVNHDRNTNFIYDLRGGIFTFNPEIRRAYLSIRFGFIYSLWDMHSKYKMHQLYCLQP
ncbi:MAG: hypothetical protein ACXABG_16625 [Promethearchaeota archaeon]|jgi:hypothetical protein